MSHETPALALLLDVDGPIASPVSRNVSPGIIASLLALVQEGIPVIFNTGRSAAFIEEEVMAPMLQAGIPANAVIHAICEKGAVWFSFSAEGSSAVNVDRSLAVPTAFADDIRSLVEEKYANYMFFDETKLAMVSVEQSVAVDNGRYLVQQKLFDADALDIFARHGLGVAHLANQQPSSEGNIGYRIEPTIISTDIESIRLGKDLGARRALELLTARGIEPQAWRTVGDSRSDYAMADWLFEHGHQVKHVDVRPADGVPEKAYKILTAVDLGLGPEVIHDDAGAAFLQTWLEQVAG